MPPEKILLIISDPKISQSLENTILIPCGYEVTRIPGASACDSFLKSQAPDLVILADELADGQALELAQRLFERYPQLPVILLSSQASEMGAVEALRMGFGDYLSLPLRNEEMVQAVQRSLQRRQRLEAWAESHLDRVSAPADHSTGATESARLFARSENERQKLETILTKIEEGVIVVDHDSRVILMNRTARTLFKVEEKNLNGRRIQDVLQHSELLEALSEDQHTRPYQMEVALEDSRIFNAQFTPIPESQRSAWR
jgi:PAS domain S-box-containing protein